MIMSSRFVVTELSTDVWVQRLQRVGVRGCAEPKREMGESPARNQCNGRTRAIYLVMYANRLGAGNFFPDGFRSNQHRGIFFGSYKYRKAHGEFFW